MAMLPGMIEVIVRVVAAGVVAYPLIVIGMYMRRSGVSGLFVHVGGNARLSAHRRGTVGRDVTAADAMRRCTVTAAAGWVLRIRTG